RRHQPTRRVALGDHYLPTSGPAYGAVLLGAVVSENLDGLDDEQRELLPRLLADAEDGLSVPRIALRHRLQTDTHGLDPTRHRIVADGGPLTLERDTHGWPTPQVLGAVMAAGQLPATARRPAFRAIANAVARPGMPPEGLEVRRLLEGVPGLRPYAPGAAARPNGGGNGDEDLAAWRGGPAGRPGALGGPGVRGGSSADSAACCGSPILITAPPMPARRSGSPSSPRRGSSCSRCSTTRSRFPRWRRLCRPPPQSPSLRGRPKENSWRTLRFTSRSRAPPGRSAPRSSAA